MPDLYALISQLEKSADEYDAFAADPVIGDEYDIYPPEVWELHARPENIRLLIAAIRERDAEIERLKLDSERLDWLGADHGCRVFCVGSRWYSRRSYGMPWRKRADLRDAIDAARKER